MWAITRLGIFATVAVLLLATFASSSHIHPLDPLTQEEIEATVAIIKKFRAEDLVFNYIYLKEPEKALLLPYFLKDQYPPPGSIPRKSFVTMYDRKNQKTYEVTVNLSRKQVEKWVDAPDGVQPTITGDELVDAEKMARLVPEVIERCNSVGWTNMSLVNGDPWTIGYVEDRPEYQGKRLVQLLMYGEVFDHDNIYAHPFDFLVIVDINNGKVINIEDLPAHDDFDGSKKDGNDVPLGRSNFHPKILEPSFYRKDLKRLNVSSPNGVSYSVKGNEVSWQKFKFRVGFNGREGLVIYNINYKDGKEVRPLFYRLSLGEMFVPYGDPRPPYHRKHVFDEGQYGLGVNAFELRPQQDCIGQAHFFDGVLHNETGHAKVTPNVICMVEEDAGILWKHTDFRTLRNVVVRSQRLALTFIATVGNYDYIFTWNFHQDGTIQFLVKMSGILSTNLLSKNATSAGYGLSVFPQINAQYHQHFFNVRIDPEIDGNENTVVVNDVIPLKQPTGSKENPYGQGFTTRSTIFRTASTARTNIAPESSRTWHIRNPNRRNPYSKRHVAWKLMPWATTPLMMKPDCPIRDKARWLDYSTWVTPYHDDQMFPGGFYLNNSGLPEWVANNPNGSIDNTDIVVWYNFGLTHIPRVEDFPVMPVETCGFMLKPLNFFNENPALDVPPAGM